MPVFQKSTAGRVLWLALAALIWLGMGPRAFVRAEGGPNKIFLPQVSGTGAAAALDDLKITRVEITQGVQDASNSVPLVAGRETRLRIYAQNTDSSGLRQQSSSVSVSVSATRQGSPLPGSPEVIDASLSAAAAPDQYASTINVKLPPEWWSSSYDLTVTLTGPDGSPDADPANNTAVHRVDFHAVPALEIMLVPVAYTHQPDGAFYPAPTQDLIGGYLRRLYPVSRVNITWHAPFAFTGNLKDTFSFSDLLSKIDTLKTTEGRPESTIYYALVPTRSDAGTWFYSGVVGLGYINRRVSVGLDYSGAGQTAAHEIGHNLGRYHAPCGSPSSPDAQYPYKNASIGAYGLDLFYSIVYLPDTGKDIMSYCSPRWVSDYTYKALFDALASPQVDTPADLTGADQARAASSLLVRGVIHPSGAEILPVYALDRPVQPAPASSEYTLRLVGAGGETLLETPVRVDEAAQEGERGGTSVSVMPVGDPFASFSALVPQPAQPAVRVILLRGGSELASLDLSAAAPAPSSARTAQAKSAPVSQVATVEQTGGMLVLRWDGIEPALVRYSPDGGATWQVLGIDVTGGSLSIGAAGLDTQAGIFEVITAPAAP